MPRSCRRRRPPSVAAIRGYGRNRQARRRPRATGAAGSGRPPPPRRRPRGSTASPGGTTRARRASAPPSAARHSSPISRRRRRSIIRMPKQRERGEAAEHQDVREIAVRDQMRDRPQEERGEDRVAHEAQDARVPRVERPRCAAPEGERIGPEEAEGQDEAGRCHRRQHQPVRAGRLGPERHVRRAVHRDEERGEHGEGQGRIGDAEARVPQPRHQPWPHRRTHRDRVQDVEAHERPR